MQYEWYMHTLSRKTGIEIERVKRVCQMFLPPPYAHATAWRESMKAAKVAAENWEGKDAKMASLFRELELANFLAYEARK